MRKLILVLGIMLSTFSLFAQVDTTKTLQHNYTPGIIYKVVGGDSASLFPNDTFRLKYTWRGISFKGALPYYWDGTQYRSFGSGPTDTVYLFVSGQSNAWGTTRATPYDTAADPRVEIWDAPEAVPYWKTFRINQKPMRSPGYNYLDGSSSRPDLEGSVNAVFYLAKKIATQENKHVRVVMAIGDGQSISQWFNGTSRGRFMDTILQNGNNSGIPRVDAFFWDQGESDNAMSEETYMSAFDSIKATLRRQSWFPQTTPIIVTGLPKAYFGANTGFIAKDSTLQKFNFDNDPWTGYAQTDSLRLGIYDAIHFNDTSMKKLGEEIYWQTWHSLPDHYRNSFYQHRGSFTIGASRKPLYTLDVDGTGGFSSHLTVGGNLTANGPGSHIIGNAVFTQSSNDQLKMISNVSNFSRIWMQSTNTAGSMGIVFQNHENRIGYMYVTPSVHAQHSSAFVIRSHMSKGIIFETDSTQAQLFSSNPAFNGFYFISQQRNFFLGNYGNTDTTMFLSTDANGLVILKKIYPGAGGGGVTSVSAGFGTNFSTITSTGSIVVDTTNIASWARLYKVRDSLLTLIGGGGGGFSIGSTAITGGIDGSLFYDSSHIASNNSDLFWDRSAGKLYSRGAGGTYSDNGFFTHAYGEGIDLTGIHMSCNQSSIRFSGWGSYNWYDANAIGISQYDATTLGVSDGSTTFWYGAGLQNWIAKNITSTGRLLQSKGADVSSAGDLTLGTDGNTFHITGTTTINAITTSGWRSGTEINLIFDASVTVKNNTAGGGGTAVMKLAGGADFSATSNDVLTLLWDGTSFFEKSRSVN